MERKEVGCTCTYEDGIMKPTNAVCKRGGGEGNANIMGRLN
jgi:hypothetical protein